jgi:formamidopyrimidine-DNA glycosylase
MPELPELEVVREVLQRHVVGQVITDVEIRPPGGPLVIRDATGQGFAATVTGRMISGIRRRDQFLIFDLAGAPPPPYLVVNPKLTGRLQLADAADKRLPKTQLIFTLSSGRQLRYIDAKVMGQLYLTANLEAVPDYASLGPEALEVSLEDFKARLKPFRGEIKGVLTRGQFVAGIGNAYADEILWTARLHPFRRRTQLTEEEIVRLYEAMRTALMEAIERVRILMGEQIHLEPRGFMAVHMKTGEPCPRCGTPISLIGANQRITNFCRHCQPGGLIRGM